MQYPSFLKTDREIDSWDAGRKKIRDIRHAFGDKDVVFYLKCLDKIDENAEKAESCSECRGSGRVECWECDGAGSKPCDCQE